MKKILALVTVLALIAALVVPMAVSASGSTTSGAVNENISGLVPAVPSQLNMSTPSDITDWSTTPWLNNANLTVGTNFASTTPGSVSFTQGNDGMTGWDVTLTCSSDYTNGAMYDFTAGDPGYHTFLPNGLKISFDGSSWQAANTAGFDWNGTNSGISLPLYAQQVVGTTDKAGTYSIVLVYTLTPKY